MSDQLNFYVNYECTSAADHFFRNTGKPFTFTVTPINPPQYSTCWYIIDSVSSNKIDINTASTFTPDTSCVHTITLLCSSVAFAPNISSKSVSAIFLKDIPKADYVSWPMYYIPTNTKVIKLSASNYNISPDVSFYGETHTDTITFQAIGTAPANSVYNWSVSSINAVNTSLTSASAAIQSVHQVSASLPVTLNITNSSLYITHQSPNYYYDDTTGEKLPYPYFYNTQSNPKNNNHKQNVVIKTYPLPQSVFQHDIPTPIFMLSGVSDTFHTHIEMSLVGDTLSGCYGKYGDNWKWSTLKGKSDLVPGTWYSTSSSGLFPKKWKDEPAKTVDFVRSPIRQTVYNIRRAITTENWTVAITANHGTPTEQLVDNEFSFITSTTDLSSAYTIPASSLKTTVTISVTAIVKSEMPVFSEFTVYDWNQSTRAITHTLSTYAYTVPSVSLFIPNQYVLYST